MMPHRLLVYLPQSAAKSLARLSAMTCESKACRYYDRNRGVHTGAVITSSVYNRHVLNAANM